MKFEVLGNFRRLLGGVFWKAAISLTRTPTVARPRWTQVRAGYLRGTHLCLDLRDGTSREMIEGVYDCFIYDSLAELGVFRDGIIAWDIGAHLGYHSLMLAALAGPMGRVYAFEPNPFNLERLQQHLERNEDLAKRIQLRGCAISNFDGRSSFRFSPFYFQSSIGYLDTDGSYPSDRVAKSTYDELETASVPVCRADSLIEEGLQPPGLIKVDVEGAEAQVLEGARELLSAHRPILIIEIHNVKNMFLTQGILLEHQYKLRFLEDPEHRSSSRGFVLAS